MDANDLINELKQQTENSTINNTIEGNHEAEKFSSPAEEHFEPVVDELQQQAPEPEFTSSAAKSTARRYLQMASSFLKLILRPIYKKTILQKQDISKMAEFNRKNSGKSEKQMEEALHSESEMWPVVNRFERYMKAVKEIPFDDDELEMMATPLSELIIKHKALRLSPEWMMVIAVSMVMLPRITNMIPTDEKQ
jgi:hypothetical protein